MSSKGKQPAGSGGGGGGGGGRPTIRTLADLNRGPAPSDAGGSDDDEPQEYYTGGEKSGMLVQDPTKKTQDVDLIFEQARRLGATPGPIEQQQPSSSFTGTGRLLSGEERSSSSSPQQPENVIHNIYFWTNGFTVNDGPLRSFDDVANASFLQSILRSECPQELQPADRRTMVNVNLIRRNEDYQEPVRRPEPFQGVGRTLGSAAPADHPSAAPVSSMPTNAVKSSGTTGISVDDSRPSTSIQLRLADGTRMVARFNFDHTIGDIRMFIDASRPGSARTYQLQTAGFPPTPLTDVTKTIAESGLANSVIIQRM